MSQLSITRRPRPGHRSGSRVRGGRRATALLCLVSALLAAGPAAAAPDWRANAREQLEQNLVRPPGISVEQCANIVRRQTGGRVLSAAPAERGGQRGCEVRVLVDGKRVKSLFVDGDGRVRGDG